MENVTSQCRIAEIAVKTMKHRGTNVLEVDMSKPLSNSINTLVNALKEFALKQQCYST